jgi:hypothetical protein
MSNKPRLILPPGTRRGRRVTNTVTGRVYPCCYSDCESDGSTSYEVSQPHESPRWPGERVVYIFCSAQHKAFFLRDTPLENRA